MKVGFRRRSFKSSFKARTTGRLTRSVKKTVIPWYGKRGAGLAHPKKKIYSKIYSKTTVGIPFTGLKGKK